MVNMFKIMEINTQGISWIGKNMEKVKSSLVMVINTKEIIRMENHMDLVNIFGVMVQHFKAIFLKDYDMVKVFGEEGLILQLINIKENMKKIKKMDMEYINGLMEMNIEECLLMIINMDMGRCIIKMDMF